MPLTDVIVDNRTDLGKTAGFTSLSSSVTISSGLTNPALVCTATTGSGTAKRVVSAVLDPGGTPFSLDNEDFFVDQDTNIYAELWGKAGCPTGVTKTFTITPTASCEITGGVASYQGVNQTTMWNASKPTPVRVNTGTTAQITVPSAVHEMVIAVLGENGGSTLASTTTGSSTIHNENIGSGQHAGMSIDVAGAATSVVCSFSGITTNNSCVLIGGSLQFDAGGGGASAVEDSEPPIVLPRRSRPDDETNANVWMRAAA